MIKVMGQCVDEMRWNDNPRLLLELYSLRLTQPFVDAGELLRRLERLEKSTGDTEIRRVIPNTTSDTKKSEGIKTASVVPSSPATLVSPASPVSPADAALPAVSASPDIEAMWKRLLTELWKKPSVASHLERAHLKSATDKEWLIGFVDAFAMESVQRNQAFLDETVTAVVGHPIKVRLVQQAIDRREGEEATVVILPVAEEKARAAVQDVRVQKVLDVFKGKVRE